MEVTKNMKKSLSIGEVIKFAWKAFKENWGFFIALVLLAWITPLVPYVIGVKLQHHYPLFSGIFFVIYFVLGVLMSMGLVNVGLIFSKNQKANFADLFKPWKKIVNFFIATLFFKVLVFVGLILLVFPGLIWAARYGLVQYFVLDKDQGPIEAFHSSAKATMGVKWDYLSLLILFLVMILAGVLAVFVGLFVAIPIVLVAHAYAYRKLVEQTSELQETVKDLQIEEK